MTGKKESTTIYSVLSRHRSSFSSNSIVKHTLKELIWKILELHKIGLEETSKTLMAYCLSQSRDEEAHKIFLPIL